LLALVFTESIKRLEPAIGCRIKVLLTQDALSEFAGEWKRLVFIGNQF
jgi:hypothetical protein